MGRLDREMDSNNDESMEECVEVVGDKGNSEQMRPAIVTPLAAFHPEVGLIDMESKTTVGANVVGDSTGITQADQ